MQEHEDFKRMAMKKSFPRAKDSTQAVQGENTDRTQRRIQHTNIARLDHISFVQNYVVAKLISMKVHVF